MLTWVYTITTSCAIEASCLKVMQSNCTDDMHSHCYYAKLHMIYNDIIASDHLWNVMNICLIAFIIEVRINTTY